MRKIVGLIALIALVVIALSCSSDIVFEEEESLNGVYKGWYIITELGEQPVEHKQTINWKFDDPQYNMSIDTMHVGWDPQECICLVFGLFDVKDKVRLKQAQGQPGQPHAGCSTCKYDFNPEGTFNVDRSTDTLKLTQQDTQLGLLKEIKLLRVSEE